MMVFVSLMTGRYVVPFDEPELGGDRARPCTSRRLHVDADRPGRLATTGAVAARRRDDLAVGDDGDLDRLEDGDLGDRNARDERRGGRAPCSSGRPSCSGRRRAWPASSDPSTSSDPLPSVPGSPVPSPDGPFPITVELPCAEHAAAKTIEEQACNRSETREASGSHGALPPQTCRLGNCVSNLETLALDHFSTVVGSSPGAATR